MDRGHRGWDSGDSCWTEFSPGHPLPGATDAYYRGSIQVEVWSGDGSETIVLSEAGGPPVSGTVSDDGWNLVFRPDAPLRPDTDYQVGFQYCDGLEATWDFRTSSVGTPLQGCDPGATHFVLDVTDGRVVAPVGVGELLLGVLEGEALLTVDPQASSPRLVLGYGDGTDVETCAPAEALPVSWTDPHFEAAAAVLGVRAVDTSLTTSDVVIAGDMSADCTELAGVSISGAADVREMTDQLGDLLGITDPDEICATMTGFGVSCEDCPDGETYCIEFDVEDIDGTARGTGQSPSTEAEVLALGECTDIEGGCSVAPARRALGTMAAALLALGLATRRRRRT